MSRPCRRYFATKATASSQSRMPAAHLHVAAVSAALVTLAAPVLRAYAEHKEAAGLLDYDDLIGRTSALLVDPGAAWVLYKLDGGLDHLLLDEVQDTAPAAMADRARTDRGILRRRRRRARRTARCSPSATASSRSTRSRAPTSTPSTARTGCSRARVRGGGQALARRAARCVVPLHAAGAGAGRSRLRRSARRVRRGGARADAGSFRRPRGACRRRSSSGRSRRCPIPPNRSPGAVPEQNQGLTSAPQRLAETLADWIARADRRWR